MVCELLSLSLEYQTERVLLLTVIDDAVLSLVQLSEQLFGVEVVLALRGPPKRIL